jgi:hypothetical protein
MTEKKAEIHRLFDEAVNNKKSKDNDRRLYSLSFFVLLALFILAVLAGLFMYSELKKDFHSVLSDSLKRAELLEEEKKFVAAREIYLSVKKTSDSPDDKIERAIKRLDEKIQHAKEVLAYQDKIHIKNLKFWRDKYEIKVSGNIVNAGKRNLNEIELTVYCLDAYDKPVCEETIKTVSSDGKPLKRYQKRTFSFLTNYPKREFSVDIPVVLKSVKDVQIIVSDINFEDNN